MNGFPQWQTIETAPKDGTMILLGRRDNEESEGVSIPGFWQEGWQDSLDDMGCDSGFVDVHFQIFNGGRSFGADKYRYEPNQPTHWMPLPPPPQPDLPVTEEEEAAWRELEAKCNPT